MNKVYKAKSRYGDFAEFVADRDEAIFSFDKFKIETFCRKWNIRVPESDYAFWLGICESILTVPDAPLEAKDKAREWIRVHYRGNYRYDEMGV